MLFMQSIIRFPLNYTKLILLLKHQMTYYFVVVHTSEQAHFQINKIITTHHTHIITITSSTHIRIYNRNQHLQHIHYYQHFPHKDKKPCRTVDSDHRTTLHINIRVWSIATKLIFYTIWTNLFFIQSELKIIYIK